jgi:hypothetical protein
LYEALKSLLSKNYLGGRRPSPGEAAGCGMIAGGIAAALTTPLDVVKTRVMLEAKVRQCPSLHAHVRRQCLAQMGKSLYGSHHPLYCPSIHDWSTLPVKKVLEHSLAVGYPGHRQSRWEEQCFWAFMISRSTLARRMSQHKELYEHPLHSIEESYTIALLLFLTHHIGLSA